MSKQLNVSESSYKKFQAALMLNGEEEEIVMDRLINQYANSAFENAMNENKQPNNSENVLITPNEQKTSFVNWFRSLNKNGRTYNPVTISAYTGRIENACSDPIFSSVPVDNLFSITDLDEFIDVQKQIKNCVGFAEFDARSHNGFTASLRKYEEFLRFKMSGEPIKSSYTVDSYTANIYRPDISRPSSIHRWTLEEDTICCQRFLEHYVIEQSGEDIVNFLQTLSKEVPDVSDGSLRMKIQNIKYLSMRAGLKDTAQIKWLSQYSSQCERAFNQTLKGMNIK